MRSASLRRLRYWSRCSVRQPGNSRCLQATKSRSRLRQTRQPQTWQPHTRPRRIRLPQTRPPRGRLRQTRQPQTWQPHTRPRRIRLPQTRPPKRGEGCGGEGCGRQGRCRQGSRRQGCGRAGCGRQGGRRQGRPPTRPRRGLKQRRLAQVLKPTSPEGQYEMGNNYYRGVNRDYRHAAYWYQRAAESGPLGRAIHARHALR